MFKQLISQDLRSGVEKVLELKQNSDNSTEAVLDIYKKELLPILLQLRHRNRIEKNALEEKGKQVRELNLKLIDLQEACNGLSFMAACLNSDVSNMRQEVTSFNLKQTKDSNGINLDKNMFDADLVGKFDHETRMRLLDEEEDRRKSLQEKLAHMNMETKGVELSCSQGTSQLNQVKPYIKQLLDKVGPVLHPHVTTIE